jgi:serine/threonine protein kinase
VLLPNQPKHNNNLRPREPERDPLLHTRIGNYEIISRIGQGGMGNVYLGEHPIIRKKVAVKVLREDTSSRPEAVQRFWAEARMISQISHPNVVAISDFGETPLGQFYFVMEYLDGKTLSALIKEEVVFSNSRGIHILTQMAKGLSGAHAQGVIHRDLKPDNILLLDKSPDPEAVKILDFGVAKLADISSQRDNNQPRIRTEWGTVLGTPTYMSPEQASGEELDARSDLYSLGIIAYEFFTGDVPFKADTLGKLIHKHSHEIPIPPRRKNPEIFKELENLILRCLEKRPDRRPSSAAEVVKILESLAEAGGDISTNIQIPLAASKSTQPPLSALGHMPHDGEPDTGRAPFDPVDFEESTTKTPASLIDEVNVMKSGRMAQVTARKKVVANDAALTHRAPLGDDDPSAFRGSSLYSDDSFPETSKSPPLIKELLFEDSEISRRQQNGEQTRIAPSKNPETRSMRPLGKEPSFQQMRSFAQQDDDDPTSFPERPSKRQDLDRQKTDPETPFQEKLRNRGFAKEATFKQTPDNAPLIVPVPPTTWEDTSLESLRPQKSSAYKAPIPAEPSESGSWDDTAIREESDPGWAQIPTRIAREGANGLILNSVEALVKATKKPETPKREDNWDAISTSLAPSPLDQARLPVAKNNHYLQPPPKLENAQPSVYKAKIGPAFASEDFDSVEYPTRIPTGAAPIVTLPAASKPSNTSRPPEPPPSVDEDNIKTLRPNDDYIKTLRPNDNYVKAQRPSDERRPKERNQRPSEPLEETNESQVKTALRPPEPSPSPPKPIPAPKLPKQQVSAATQQEFVPETPIRKPAPPEPKVALPEPQRQERQRTVAADPMPLPKPVEHPKPKPELPKPKLVLPAPPEDDFPLPSPGPISMALMASAVVAPAAEMMDAAQLAGRARKRLLIMAIVVGALAASVVAMVLARYLKTPPTINLDELETIESKASTPTLDITVNTPNSKPIIPLATSQETPPVAIEPPLENRIAIYLDPDKPDCARTVTATSSTGNSNQIQTTSPYKPLRADVVYTFSAEGFKEQVINLSKINANELKLCLLPLPLEVIKPKIEPEKKPEKKPKVEPEKKPEKKPKIEPEKKPKVEPEKKPEKKPKVETDVNKRTGKTSNPEL